MMFRLKLFAATILSLAAVQYAFNMVTREIAAPMINQAKGNAEALGALAEGRPAIFSEGGVKRGIEVRHISENDAEWAAEGWGKRRAD